MCPNGHLGMLRKSSTIDSYYSILKTIIIRFQCVFFICCLFVLFMFKWLSGSPLQNNSASTFESNIKCKIIDPTEEKFNLAQQYKGINYSDKTKQHKQ